MRTKQKKYKKDQVIIKQPEKKGNFETEIRLYQLKKYFQRIFCQNRNTFARINFGNI